MSAAAKARPAPITKRMIFEARAEAAHCFGRRANSTCKKPWTS